jgi:acyl-CoA hydrolase
MATVDNERVVKVKHSTDMVMEAAIIGLCIYFGLQSIEVKVEIVVDRPKVEQQSSSGSTFKRQM